jgi:hypothetical protein
MWSGICSINVEVRLQICTVWQTIEKILQVIPDVTATLVFQLFLVFYQLLLYPSLLYRDRRRG